MDTQDVDCAFEKCMDAHTETFRPSPMCLVNSSRHVNGSSTASYLDYFASIFLPTISVLGIIFNLINIFVLSRTKSKSCFLRLLCFLAVFDTGRGRLRWTESIRNVHFEYIPKIFSSFFLKVIKQYFSSIFTQINSKHRKIAKSCPEHI